MELKLDAEAMAAIAGQAILQRMTEDTRNLLIQNAVAYLITPTKDSRGYQTTIPSPLQQAFNNQLGLQANKMVHEMLESDPAFLEMVQELLGPLLSAALHEEGHYGRQGLSNTIGKGVATWLNEQAMKRSDDE